MFQSQSSPSEAKIKVSPISKSQKLNLRCVIKPLKLLFHCRVEEVEELNPALYGLSRNDSVEDLHRLLFSPDLPANANVQAVQDQLARLYCNTISLDSSAIEVSTLRPSRFKIIRQNLT